jgi:hypothetical protein
MSIVEVLVATGVTTSVMAGVLAALGPAHATFVALADAGDVRQRLRAGVEAISRDLLPADEALPFPGGILIVSGPVQHTYYARSGVLRVDDGEGTDLPVVDGVSEVAFESAGERRIRVRLKMKATRPSGRDLELQFDVAPRNMAGGG